METNLVKVENTKSLEQPSLPQSMKPLDVNTRMQEIKTVIQNAGGLAKLPFEKRTFPLKEQQIGENIIAVFWGRRKQREEEVIDEKTGEVIMKDHNFIFFADPLTEEKYKMWENAGLRGAFEDAFVSKGDLVSFTRLEMKQVGKKKVNQYEISVLNTEQLIALLETKPDTHH